MEENTNSSQKRETGVADFVLCAISAIAFGIGTNSFFIGFGSLLPVIILQGIYQRLTWMHEDMLSK